MPLTKIVKRLLRNLTYTTGNSIMVIVRLSLTKFEELCSLTKNSDTIWTKSGELIYLAAKSEKRLSFKVSMITTFGKQDFVEKMIHIIK